MAAVRDGLLAAIKTLPAHLGQTLTWDQGTDLSVHRPKRLLEVANEFNDRPRKTLGHIALVDAMQRPLIRY